MLSLTEVGIRDWNEEEEDDRKTDFFGFFIFKKILKKSKTKSSEHFLPLVPVFLLPIKYSTTSTDSTVSQRFTV